MNLFACMHALHLIHFKCTLYIVYVNNKKIHRVRSWFRSMPPSVWQFKFEITAKFDSETSKFNTQMPYREEFYFCYELLIICQSLWSILNLPCLTNANQFISVGKVDFCFEAIRWFRGQWSIHCCQKSLYTIFLWKILFLQIPWFVNLVFYIEFA